MSQTVNMTRAKAISTERHFLLVRADEEYPMFSHRMYSGSGGSQVYIYDSILLISFSKVIVIDLLNYFYIFVSVSDLSLNVFSGSEIVDPLPSPSSAGA